MMTKIKSKFQNIVLEIEPDEVRKPANDNYVQQPFLPFANDNNPEDDTAK